MTKGTDNLSKSIFFVKVFGFICLSYQSVRKWELCNRVGKDILFPYFFRMWCQFIFFQLWFNSSFWDQMFISIFRCVFYVCLMMCCLFFVCLFNFIDLSLLRGVFLLLFLWLVLCRLIFTICLLVLLYNENKNVHWPGSNKKGNSLNKFRGKVNNKTKPSRALLIHSPTKKYKQNKH